HPLAAPRDERLALAGADRLRRAGDGLEPRAAQPVDGLSRHLDRQPREQRRHPRHVTVVLARLVGAPEDHVVDGLGIYPRPLDDGLDGNRRQVIRPHTRKRPAVPANGRSQRRTDVRVVHNPTQTVFVSKYPSNASRPKSRPKPEALNPPIGAPESYELSLMITTVPAGTAA